ncbi:MAG TPA: hypothetical protein VNI54_17870 [Thermoanaerobaculia bacterium]|nr:hypothetical protein [Thermoanaerobaculia bacterium]
MSTEDAADDKVVLFVDVLGFAALIEQHALDVGSIRRFERPLSLGSFDDIARIQDNPLTRTFGGFHRSIRWALEMASMRHAATAITFSDSAFIATDHFYQAAAIAIDLLQSLLPQGILVRIGIAGGSFAAVRFRSDISSDGGDHAAHFLGTAVVRAYGTERCGIKGARILLHPSTEALLSTASHTAAARQPPVNIIGCAADEVGNRAGVRYEVDYWTMKPTAETAAWHALQDQWTASAERFHDHYRATASAIDRMRVSRGAAPLRNLRRRTLPRSKPAERP